MGVLWALREAGRDVTGADLMVDSTVPLGAGLSSSAAIECAVAMAVTGLLGEEVSDDLRRALVPVCIRAETEIAGAPTGGWTRLSRCSPGPTPRCSSTSPPAPAGPWASARTLPRCW